MNFWKKFKRAAAVISVIGVAVGSGLFIIACGQKKPMAAKPESQTPATETDAAAQTGPAATSGKSTDTDSDTASSSLRPNREEVEKGQPLPRNYME